MLWPENLFSFCVLVVQRRLETCYKLLRTCFPTNRTILSSNRFNSTPQGWCVISDFAEILLFLVPMRPNRLLIVIVLFLVFKLYDTTSSDSVTSKAHTAEGKPPPKKRVPKPKNPAGGFRTGDETRAGDTSIPEEEIIPPDASSDGDYEEPAGGRKRKQSTATKGTAGKKKTAAKTEAGKTTTRQKKPKLSDEPSPAAPSPGTVNRSI